MEILDDENRRARAQLGEKRARDIVRLTLAGYDGLEVASHALCDLDERPEGSRREERIACPRESADRPFLLGAELAHQGRLPDAGLATHQQKSACPAERSGQCSAHALQSRLPFEERGQRRLGLER